MAEVLVQFAEPVAGPDGEAYIARACGGEMPDGLWQGWIEFLDFQGGNALRTGRETTQPNREHTEYWATGLTPVYLEGALDRALKRATAGVAPPATVPPPIFDGPAPADEPVPHGSRESVLNPFSAFRNGETMLRNRLSALSPRHLVAIINAHELTDIARDRLSGMSAAALIELIVAAVRTHASSPAR